MSHELKVGLGPVLVTMLPSRDLPAGCRCGLCEARRATRLAQALQNRYGHGIALVRGEINES